MFDKSGGDGVKITKHVKDRETVGHRLSSHRRTDPGSQRPVYPSKY